MRKIVISILAGAFQLAPALAESRPAAEAAPIKEVAQSAPVHKPTIHWNDWSDQAFAKAKVENKPLILDLEAVWCHWCHVMEEKTYSDPAVAELISSKFVPLRVDQDSRPDISAKYQDFGWPATIWFSPSGQEIIKRAGYIKPEEMLSILQEVVKKPEKVRESAQGQESGKIRFSATAALTPTLQQELLQRSLDGYDTKNGGWGTGHKFLDWDTVEYCMARAAGGDKNFEEMARATLKGQMKLIDPVWGGVYQYSTHGDWDHAHFEKIMQMQGENMRIFALAYELWHDPEYLSAAKNIEKFLSEFMLSPDGGFYTSMDADVVQGEHSGEFFALGDADRRKIGIPRIDKHQYSREIGWAVVGLAALYSASGEKSYLDRAIRAANWVESNRKLPSGGFSHDSKDAAGPFLEDTLVMGRAFLSLYAATGDRSWLTRASQSADFIDAHFKVVTAGTAAGYSITEAKEGTKPTLLVDQNVMVSRFMNLLFRYTGRPLYKEMSRVAMRYLATPAVARNAGMYTSGMLLADSELASEPAHITVVGRKDDLLAQQLMVAALQYPSGYRVIEWWDRREGPLQNSDVEFPPLDKSAAFGCANQRCSAPVYSPEKLHQTVRELMSAK